MNYNIPNETSLFLQQRRKLRWNIQQYPIDQGPLPAPAFIAFLLYVDATYLLDSLSIILMFLRSDETISAHFLTFNLITLMEPHSENNNEHQSHLPGSELCTWEFFFIPLQPTFPLMILYN